MKKMLAILLTLALSLCLCACPAPVEESQGIRQFHITAGKIEPGMTLKDAWAEVTMDGEPVTCTVQLISFDWEGNWLVTENEVIQESFYIRMEIYYSLPQGCELEDIQVSADCEGGQYSDTFIVCSNGRGGYDVVTEIYYGEEPQQPQPTEQTQDQHTHSWTEVPGPSIIDCTIDRVKNFQCACGKTKTETVPAPGHDLKDWHITPASCTDDGQKTTSCKRCSAGFTVDLPATGHEWSQWVKKTGLVHSRTCSVCGAEEEASHNIPDGSVTCTDCGADIIN